MVEVSVEVTNGSGEPIEGALLEWGYFNSDDYGEGYTGENGVYAFTGVAYGSLGVDVNKEGYYESSGQLWDGGSMKHPKPPDSFTVELKKIVDPVPMYVKRVETELPKLNEPVGLDLEKGDWVAPYGKGVTSDWIVLGARRFENWDNFDSRVSITFNGKHNGIQPHIGSLPRDKGISSQLPSPRMAPSNGYESRIVFEESRNPGEPINTYEKENRSYLFRIRTKTRNNEIIQASYGRTIGEIRTGATRSDTISLYFTYYYNPDPDPENRSLEWNGENLFLQGLSRSERDHLRSEEGIGYWHGDLGYPEIPEDRRPKPLPNEDSQ